jgi:hypothetical protein
MPTSCLPQRLWAAAGFREPPQTPKTISQQNSPEIIFLDDQGGSQVSVLERPLHFGPRTSITTPLRSKGFGFGLSCFCALKYASSRGRGNVAIPKGFPKSVGRVESRLLGFPCFPYSVISMACFGKAHPEITVGAMGRFREQGPSVRDRDNSSRTRSWLAAAEFSRISVPVSAGSARLCEGNGLQCVGTGKPICWNVSIRKKPRSEYT